MSRNRIRVYSGAFAVDLNSYHSRWLGTSRPRSGLLALMSGPCPERELPG
jgi:hypothetical protein